MSVQIHGYQVLESAFLYTCVLMCVCVLSFCSDAYFFDDGRHFVCIELLFFLRQRVKVRRQTTNMFILCSLHQCQMVIGLAQVLYCPWWSERLNQEERKSTNKKSDLEVHMAKKKKAELRNFPKIHLIR